MSATATVTVGSTIPATSGVYSYLIKQPDGSASGFDGVGNITAYFDSTSGQWQNIQYDALNRLVRADGPATFNTNSPYFCWSYDNYGNRTAQYSGTGAFTPSWGGCSGGGSVTANIQTYNGSNQLTSASHPVSNFGYDLADNTTSNIATSPSSPRIYAYDSEGRLCAVSTTVLSISDPSSRRIPFPK